MIRRGFLVAVLLTQGCTAHSSPAGPSHSDAVCHPAHTLEEVERYPCGDRREVDRCNEFGLLIAAFCYPDEPGPDPLSDIGPESFPSYGCFAPAEFNSGGGDEWRLWCCSKVFPGPLVCD